MGRSRLARAGTAALAGVLVAGLFGAPAAAAAGATVAGTFVTSAGTPIAGAAVVAYSAEDDWLADTSTDEDGRYSIGGLDAGQIKLQFDDHGREQWSPGVREREQATAYAMGEGATLTVNERQPATGKAAGTIAPLTNVTLVGVDHWTYLYATTDDEGRWSVDALPGTYKVYFEWDSVRQWAVQQRSEDDAETITVAAGRTTTVDDQRLPTGTAGGRLVTAAGDPLTGADVTLHYDDRTIGNAGTDEDGRYSFGEVLTGDGYKVSFSVDGGAEQWVAGTLDPARARSFTITAGELTTIDDKQLTTTTVRGRLTDPDGGAKSGYHVSVTLDDDDNWVNYDTETDADGRWSVSGVFPGDYRVMFVTDDYRRTQWAYGKGTAADAALIKVTAGTTVTVDDTWQPGATLVVNAVDATTGAAISDFCVWLDSPNDGSGCTTGNRLTITDLPGGAFNATVSPGEGSYYLQKRDVPVRLTAGQTTTVTIPVRLGGRVALAATSRATGAAVADTCPIFRQIGQGGLPDGYGNCTDRTGKATTQAMEAGTYELFAYAPGSYGHQWVARTGGTGDQRAAARIVVTPGKTVKAPAVRLDPAAPITGTVSNVAGEPLGGIDVAFSAWGDAGPAWNTKTNPQGRYTVDGLGPYGWPLLFGGADYPRQWSGTVGNRFQAEKATGTYDYVMKASSTLRGKVTAPAGVQWRINVVNAVTGDELGMFDSSAGQSYTIPVTGNQQVKVRWMLYGDGIDKTGWHNRAADFASATRIGIPAAGTRTLNLSIG
ncbi:carboxypeptidase-like regulatory domain-containing protein [Paractinoplanes lichenicola]|uniref:alpha-amylase n=1 Tax=Paractinoplanes lichenicola TaxID=2802976 RepID=A0ABS1VS08_9ACTN|nr:carboxypeptidase-like regulatory domain-containing protein [Actinoplanes lichenicola]MBL7257434.1 carboxypeptidase regulatory-like domain-containing protein [Actinoplanes lichenicola]